MPLLPLLILCSVSAASDSLSPEEILADVEVGRICPIDFFLMHFEVSSKALEKAQAAVATLTGLMERVLEDTLSMQTSEEASGEAATAEAHLPGGDHCNHYFWRKGIVF